MKFIHWMTLATMAWMADTTDAHYRKCVRHVSDYTHTTNTTVLATSATPEATSYTPEPTPVPTTRQIKPASAIAAPPSQPRYTGNNAAHLAGLNAHNAARARLGIPALKWDDKLANQSAQYAQRLSRSGCSLEHSGAPGVGENLWATYGTTSGAIDSAVNSWMSEDYYPGVMNHHSQVVWSRTTHVGCAVIPGNNCATVVCQYSPPGNFVGQRAY